MISRREKGKKWRIPFTKRRNTYCRAVPDWVPVLYTVHTPYPWKGNSYSSSSQERRERGRVSGITICIVSTGQYIFHCTWHTILKATSSSRTVVTLSSMYQVIPTNMIPSYRTINSITQSYVHAWIVGERMGTDTDTTTNSPSRLA